MLPTLGIGSELLAKIVSVSVKGVELIAGTRLDDKLFAALEEMTEPELSMPVFVVWDGWLMLQTRELDDTLSAGSVLALIR